MSKEIEEYYGNTKENRRYKIIVPVGNLTEKEFISLGKISKIFKDIKVEEYKDIVNKHKNK